VILDLGGNYADLSRGHHRDVNVSILFGGGIAHLLAERYGCRLAAGGVQKRSNVVNISVGKHGSMLR
jgi:hypothetical protein